MKDENNNEEIKKENRINQEFNRIIVFYHDLSENKKAVVLPLIQNAAFMKITLEDLQDLIRRDGVVDYYQNGANQSGLKQSAALQSYNSLIKNYAAVVKSLCDHLPPERRAALDPQTLKSKPKKKETGCRNEEIRLEQLNKECQLASEYQKWCREQTGGSKILSYEQWRRSNRGGDNDAEMLHL